MSENENKKRLCRSAFVEFLSVKAELPSDALSGDFRLELRGRNVLFVQGCRRILEYSPARMVLAIKNFNLAIEGARLVCSTYHDGTVSIDGQIDRIFLDGEEEKG